MFVATPADWRMFNSLGTIVSEAAREAFFAETKSLWFAERAARAAEDEFIVDLADKIRSGEIESYQRCCISLTGQEILRLEKAVLKRLATNEKNRMNNAYKKISRQEGTEAINRLKSTFDASWGLLKKPIICRIVPAIPASPASPAIPAKMISQLPTDIADIIFKKHAELHSQHCDDLVQKWKNAMTKFMINGRLEDKYSADDIRHELRNTDSAIAFTLHTSSTMIVSANTNTSSLTIIKCLTYTIKTTRTLYEVMHTLNFPGTQITDDTTSQFEVLVGSRADNQRATMVKTAGELLDLMEYEKPDTTYTYKSKYVSLWKFGDLKIRAQ